MEIVKAFKTAYGKDLIDNIKKETNNNFQRLLVALCTPLTQYYCEELNNAMSGAGTDEDALIEVLVGLPNNQIHAINAQYSYMYKTSLEQALEGETSNCFRRILRSLLTGNRDESLVTDLNSARNDAQVLKNSGVGRWGTDESEFNRILCLRNKEQLKIIAQEYEKLSGNTLEKDIKKEFSGDIEDAMVAILRCAINTPLFFAKRIHNAMAGFGTDDRALIRLIVTRSEIDMQDIKEEYQRKYNGSLKSMVKGDTSGKLLTFVRHVYEC
jgi:annexin A7/11